MVRALHRRGHDISVVPLYLPILLDSEELDSSAGVFFGGVNVFLQQNLSLFRWTPRWLDKFFDASWMLRQAASREGSTRAVDLGPMTYSMLQGRVGKQKKELDRLLEWLKDQPKPDLVHISNALLLGLAADIKAALQVPIVCSLQDEDTFIDAMDQKWRDRCWKIISEKAADVDMFLAVSDWYAKKMQSRIKVSPDKMRTTRLGIEWESVAPATLPFDPPVLGFLSRINASQGFTALVDAFIELKRDPKLKNLKLRATGGVTSGDQEYVKEMLAKLNAAGVGDDVEIVEDFTRAGRQRFIQSLTVLSVPAPDGEAFGLFILEAGICGVPVVQPDAGAFREVTELTGGGIVYDQTKPGALVESLKALLLDTDRAKAYGDHAREVVHAQLTSKVMAERVEAVFSEVVSKSTAVRKDAVGSTSAVR